MPQDVSFTYGGKQILDRVSFRLEGGQTLGLVGSSGCGKSTILRLLLRFYRPSSGTILIDGNDITKASTLTPLPPPKPDTTRTPRSEPRGDAARSCR